MNIYLIKNNNNILGIYIDLDIALDYVYGLINSNLIQKSSNIVIYKYKKNSCIILKEYTIDLNYEISQKKNINYHKSIFIKQEDNKYESDSLIESSQITSINTIDEEYRIKNEREFINKQNILGQNKINVVHDINLLKEEVKKKEEKLNQYNYDLELYNKFKDTKNKNSSFIIPILFEQKYNIFNILDNQNKLTYDNFMKTYKPEKINTQYIDLFEEDTLSEKEDTLSEKEDTLSEKFEKITDKSDSIISEVFSNAKDEDLYLATNQLLD